MAMNKKEKAYVEEVETFLALHYTYKIDPDIKPPGSGDAVSALKKGFLFNSYSNLVKKSCTSSRNHSFGNNDKTTTQGTRSLYSTKKLALQALRYEVEVECAQRLHAIDKQIKAEG